MLPILLLFFPLHETLLLVGIIHGFGNIWKIYFFKKGLRWKLILLFGIPGIFASYLGARIVFSFPEKTLSQILGGFLVAYVIFLFFNPKFKAPKNSITAMAGGTLSGLFSGIFGMGGAVRSAFLSAFDLRKSIFIATAGAIGLFIDTTRIATYLTNGARLETNLLIGLFIFIPASFLGAFVAKKIVSRIPQNKFRIIITAFIFIIGIKLLVFP